MHREEDKIKRCILCVLTFTAFAFQVDVYEALQACELANETTFHFRNIYQIQFIGLYAWEDKNLLLCGEVCIGLVIIWYAINHKTCADQNQSPEVFVFHNPHFYFTLWSHKNK